MPLPEHDDCCRRGDVRTLGSAWNAGFGNVLLATEVTKLTRRQQWTVFRVQRPNLSTVSDTPLLSDPQPGQERSTLQASESMCMSVGCAPVTSEPWLPPAKLKS